MNQILVSKTRLDIKKIVDLQPSAKFVYYILNIKKILNRKQIQEETLLPKRTVGSALTCLLNKGLIYKIEGSELEALDFNYRKKVDYREVYFKLATLS